MTAAGPHKALKQLEARGRAWLAIALACGALLLLLCSTQSRPPSLPARLSLGGFEAIGDASSSGGGPSSSLASLLGLGAGGSGGAQECDLDVTQGPLAKTCTLIRDVCIDQVGRRGGWQGGSPATAAGRMAAAGAPSPPAARCPPAARLRRPPAPPHVWRSKWPSCTARSGSRNWGRWRRRCR